MSSAEIANLEHASRAAMALSPEGYDGETHYGYLLRAVIPAVGILAVAAILLFAVL